MSEPFAAGVPASWVVGDSVYGDARRLRLWLETQERAYVLAVSSKEYVWLGGMQRSVKSVLEGLDEDAWQRLSAGSGSKGPRLYDWQCVRLMAPGAVDWCRYLLVRRSLQADRKLTAYAVFAPSRTELATLVSVAGRRWCIEMCFEAAKGEVGLDEYEVRSWTGWYRHVTLSMWALALLSVVRAAHLEVPEKKTVRCGHSGGLQGVAGPCVALSVPEVRRLLWRLVVMVSHGVEQVLGWCKWRRRHQWVARWCHYQRRQAKNKELQL